MSFSVRADGHIEFKVTYDGIMHVWVLRLDRVVYTNF